MFAHSEMVQKTWCSLCIQEASNSKGLRQHKNQVHGRRDAKNLALCNSICDRCGFAALDTIELRRHVAEKHDKT